MSEFTFRVLPSTTKKIPAGEAGCAFLVEDNWDDWFTYSTMYSLVVFDKDGERHDIGSVKIGEFQADGEKNRRPGIPKSFTKLDEKFFSLGQDDSYYDSLNKLKPSFKRYILNGLNDLAVDQNLFERAQHQDITQTSLLRSITPATVRGQFKRLAEGGARLSNYHFSYTAPRQVATSEEPLSISFDVEAESNPPSNIHVLIGRNGVGKTYLLDRMANALVGEKITRRKFGVFSSLDDEDAGSLFANLISVTFSAFDQFIPIAGSDSKTKYHYIGLKQIETDGSIAQAPKSPDMLTGDFVESMKMCLRGPRKERWNRAIAQLESDPIFREAGIADLGIKLSLHLKNATEFGKIARSTFKRLSSGHKIVLLTITKLVELVAERSLILLDEPEAHLHPPLLGAFVRALSDLLVNRNGVAIIATHSPVVLQEVPRKCAWKLRRHGSIAVAERPDLETFGENTGVLTREVFGLEVIKSGYHKLITEALDGDKTYDQVIADFGNEVGAEAKAIIRTLIATRRSQVS
ncbi:MAG TPA: AAA family ATPase [Bdellovibrio sp.]|uniref:ATP-dependent nuclease n=1 Tax=Bdellovibrio sp. TaxID=28201 RepID=UPI002EEE1CCF